jgi:competence protein ComGC
MFKNINNKLKDNRGWGLAEMLVLSGILLLALLLASYLIYKLYNTF